MSFWKREVGGISIRGGFLLLVAAIVLTKGIDTLVDGGLRLAFGPRAQTITVKSSPEAVRCVLQEVSYGGPVSYYDLPRHTPMPFVEIVAIPDEGLAVVRERGQKWGMNHYYFVNQVPTAFKVGQVVSVSSLDMLR